MSAKGFSFCCKGRVDEVVMLLDVYKSVLEDDSSETELIRAGIFPEAMGFLRAAERREILLRAGLNPEEFDF